MTNPKPNRLHDLLRVVEQKRERDLEDKTPVISSTISPPESVAATDLVAATDSGAVTKSVVATEKSSLPQRIVAATEFGVATEFAATSESVVAAETPHTRAANEIFDRIMPTLKPAAQIVLWRLFRLSIGFNSQTCFVTVGKLAEMCNLGTTVVRESLGYLEGRGLIKRLHVEYGAKNRQEKGITFLVKLPRLAPTKSGAPSKSGAPPHSVATSKSVPNKETHIKETHTNTEGVCVGSRFSLAECRKYAEHLNSTGQGITNPGGYATKIHRSGEADDLIAAFLEPVESANLIDSSQCPDCHGTGFWEPGGAGKGVAKCRHERLKT
jgi:hypothetical protein